MLSSIRGRSRGTGAALRQGLLLAVMLSAGTAIAAEDWPVLRHGLWEFNRTMESAGKGGPAKSVQARQCVNPTDDMKRQREMLGKSGCRFSPISRSGNVYTYSATCTMQGLSGTSKSALTVVSDSAYTLRVESDFGGEATRELLQAKRLGDCTR